MKKGDVTKQKILDVAESAILARGFAGASIDSIIDDVGITKGGFFYHFKDKNDLIEKLVMRFLEKDDLFFEELFVRADELVDDPLQNYLVFLKLFAEAMTNLPDTHPGCLVASVCYQNQCFDRSISELNKKGVEKWRKMFLERLQKIEQIYPNKSNIDVISLADAVTSTVEGGIVLSRVFDEKNLLPQQILIHRDHVRLIFSPNQPDINLNKAS